jgi:Uma2 family endonuclease
MRAVMLEVPSSLLRERQRLGHDRWDEVWEGELHMLPPPHAGHQRLNDLLGRFFLTHWEELGLGRTYPETGVKRPGAPPQEEMGKDVPSDYRTPDRSFLLPERYGRVQGGWIVGGADAVLEIVSPRDESRAKLPFYFSVGVREVVLIDRDTRDVEVLHAGTGAFETRRADASGWVPSQILGTELRREADAAGAALLHVRRTGDPGREAFIGA